jgi:hypothetical protein
MDGTHDLSLPRLRIVAIEAEMPVIPHPDCAEIKETVQKIQDLEIKHGFTEAVQRLLGKTEGCLHMMNLVLAMGSAAVQGMWSHMSGKRLPHENRPAGHHDMLVDSCWNGVGRTIRRQAQEQGLTSNIL